MSAYKIFLEYKNVMSLENDLLEAKMVHPIFKEYLYFKYLKRVKTLINWTKKENPIIHFKIINNSALLLHNGSIRKNNLTGSITTHDDLKRHNWLVDELNTKKNRTITI